MFGFFTGAVENALTVGEKLITLEAPTKREIAKLDDDGFSVYAIASIVGVSSEVVQAYLEGEG